MKDEEMAEQFANNGYALGCTKTPFESAKEGFLAGLNTKKKQFEKVEYTLKKIIETVHNDRIDEYGRRLVLINDFAYECLQEIEK